MTITRYWRRNLVVNRRGETVPISDDWQLLDGKGCVLGQIKKDKQVPDGHWHCYVHVSPAGLASGLSGAANSGKEAMCIVESRIPPNTVHHETHS